MASFRDDAPPWSFFIPITLAVIVGVLAADVIRYAIGTVFGGQEAAEQAAPPPRDAPAESAEVEEADTAASAAEARTDAEPQPVAAPAPEAAAAGHPDAAQLATPRRSDGVLELPDSMNARRDGDPAACVNGTVANRVAGGWEQALENDAPVPCVVVNR